MRPPRWLLVAASTICCWFATSVWATPSISAEVTEQLKSTLLPMFGMTNRPPKVSSVQIPDVLWQMYEMQMKRRRYSTSIPLAGVPTGSANTVRTFVHSESSIDRRFKGHSKFRLKFNMNSVPRQEQLVSAELKVIVEALLNRLAKNRLQRLIINDIVKPGIKGKYGPIIRVIDTKHVNLTMNRTASFNVLPAVRRWLHEPQQNHGLLVTIAEVDENGAAVAVGSEGSSRTQHHRNVRLRRSTAETSDRWAAKQPLLLVYTDDGRNKNAAKSGGSTQAEAASNQSRRRRATRNHHHHHHRYKSHQRDPCKRRSMYVNFQDVGWSDWIVAPLGFDAFYCGGECEYPMADHMNTTNHAIVQSLMNSARPTHVPKPCCVPTQLSSMSMLYVDGQKNVILKNYKDMVAIGCGCR